MEHFKDLKLEERPPYMKYVFQPIFDVRGKEPVVYGYEALMRPDNKPPIDFIDKATKAGNLHELEYSTFYNAIEQFMARNYEGKLFINSFLYERLTDRELYTICQLLGTERHKDLVIEILEYGKNVFKVDIIDKLKYLRNYGFRFALDDFGTGIHSVDSLKLFNPDIVKIDKNFVSHCTENSTTRNVLEIIIHMLKMHEVLILAEGAETKAEYDYLIEKRVDFIQGFYLGYPE